MVFLSSVAGKLPASIVFTLNSITCILAGCIVSVIAFKEKIKPAWWGTIIFGVIAVIMANIIL
jgi:multidrug transporter EmrE-like cation transporter